MHDAGFRYLAVKESNSSDRPSSIIAHLVAIDGPVQAVVWNVPLKAWTFDARTAAAYLYDDNFFDERFPVDRARAEQIARDRLHTELPDEEKLRRMCAAGLAAWMAEEDLSDAFGDDDDLDDEAWEPEEDEPQRPVS